MYVAGTGASATWGSPVNAHAGADEDAFAAKLNSSGALQWNTFMGSANNRLWLCGGIALDGGGNVHVAGWQATATWGSPVNAHAGG